MHAVSREQGGWVGDSPMTRFEPSFLCKKNPNKIFHEVESSFSAQLSLVLSEY